MEEHNKIVSFEKKVARYSSLAFPPYRYIPGKNPHPTEDPQGHAYGKIEKNILTLRPDNWSRNETYLYGIDLYNDAYWWEAHEAWESLWRKVPRGHVTGQFLQGLIQISAAFLKWYLKQRKGAGSLYNTGILHLQHVLQEHEVYMGLNLMKHIAEVSNHFRVVVADLRQWPDPQKYYPLIVLEDRPALSS